MYFVWLPYLRIAWPDHAAPRSLRLGRAELLEDSELIWTQRMARARPAFLQIFREFPDSAPERQPPAAYGSILQTQDPGWLQEHTDEVIATISWLGDSAQRSVPGELFSYLSFRLPEASDTSSDAVSFRFKQVLNVESKDSLRVLPPLATRGFNRQYRIIWEDAAAAALLALLRDNPSDRRVVAVRQYFRTHFNDPFLSSAASDCASHCSAIEAALGIDARRDGQRQFVDALVSRYGDHQGRREFFNGLYVARSLFVHGATAADLEAANTESYEAFGTVNRLSPVLRAMTRDVIIESLAPRAHRQSGHYVNVTVERAFGSDETWSRTKTLFTQRGAADAIESMNGDKFEAISSLAETLDGVFAWSCVREEVSDDAVCQALITCALLITRAANISSRAVEAAKQLGEAARRRDGDALGKWRGVLEREPWASDLVIGSRAWVIGRIAATLALWFDPIRFR